jgi:plastocyanin
VRGAQTDARARTYIAVSDQRERRSKGHVIEFVLTLLAVIAGSVAATGSFLGASYERDRVELERRPAVLLACQPEFHALDVAEGTRPPTNTILFTARGARWIHIVSDGRSDTPQPFARCTLTSYGRLPVFNLRVPLQAHLVGASHDALVTVDSSFDVPGLSPSEPYPFGLINGANTSMTFQFARALTLTPVDSGKATVETLFLDQGALNLQQRIVEAADPVTAVGATARSKAEPLVHVVDFSYAPSSLAVRTNETVTFVNDDAEAHTVTGPPDSFDSGPIDPQAQWRHVFSRPGVYYYRCSFHPYMRGRIVVSK